MSNCFIDMAFSTTSTRENLAYFIGKESLCSANGERDRPRGVSASVLLRACVRWMSAGTRPVPSRCGANETVFFAGRSEMPAKG